MNDCTTPATALPLPPKGQRCSSLHCMRNKGVESFVWWSKGRWIFWIGHERTDRRTPAEAAAQGWEYLRLAVIAENGAAS